MPHNSEQYRAPEGNRILSIDHVTGEVWYSRNVGGSERTELLNAARAWSARASVKLVEGEDEGAAAHEAPRCETHFPPERGRMLHIDHLTGEVWFTRLVTSQLERTELLNAAQASWSRIGAAPDVTKTERARRGPVSLVPAG